MALTDEDASSHSHALLAVAWDRSPQEGDRIAPLVAGRDARRDARREAFPAGVSSWGEKMEKDLEIRKGTAGKAYLRVLDEPSSRGEVTSDGPKGRS